MRENRVGARVNSSLKLAQLDKLWGYWGTLLITTMIAFLQEMFTLRKTSKKKKENYWTQGLTNGLKGRTYTYVHVPMCKHEHVHMCALIYA